MSRYVWNWYYLSEGRFGMPVFVYFNTFFIVFVVCLFYSIIPFILYTDNCSCISIKCCNCQTGTKLPFFVFWHYSNCAVKNTSIKSHNVCIVSKITKTMYIHKYKKWWYWKGSVWENQLKPAVPQNLFKCIKCCCSPPGGATVHTWTLQAARHFLSIWNNKRVTVCFSAINV